MVYGYNGKIAIINLKKKEYRIEKLDEKTMRKYMGGKGLISYYMNREEDCTYDPMNGEDNKLYYMTGIMSGIPAAGTSRIVIGGKSPLTGGFGNSESGGFFATELKKAGFDGLIIEQKSDEPVYLYIKDGEIEFRKAGNLWGMTTGDAYDAIKKELDNKRARISLIGPAGENGVLYSCILNDLKHACGRNGLGATMGSKNLKAIATYGSKEIQFKDRDRILEISKWYSKHFKENPLSYGLYEYGTAGGVTSFDASGILPTRNFREGSFEGAEGISGKKMAETILKKREGCYACPIRCKRVVEFENEKFSVDAKYGGPEYETVAAMGSLCGIDNIEVVAKGHELCNAYGIDTISAGVSIAFAMECYEKGLLDRINTNGTILEFGNEDAMLEMLEKIVYKIGVGSILAMGTKKASEIIGGDSYKYAMQVKGQELAMHEPRGKTGVGLGYVLSPTGADHMQATHDTMFAVEGPLMDVIRTMGIPEPVSPLSLELEKVTMYMYLEMWWSFLNMAGVCDFVPEPRGSMPITDLIDLLNAATGWNTSLWELMKVGERGIVSSRMYNYRCGLDSSTDVLPDRLFEPLESGKLKGVRLDRNEFDKALNDYYKMMNYNEQGYPNRIKIEELGLEELYRGEYGTKQGQSETVV